MENSADISIIVPAFNEESRIAPTLEKVIDFSTKDDKTFEIIVVDDGSSDSTREIVKSFEKKAPCLKLLSNGRNEGKGYSVKKGVLNAGGKWIYFTDADLSTPIEEINRFLKEIENADIVIGSRSIKGANILVHEPIYREILGKLFNKIVKLACVSEFVDTQCGAKLFRSEAAKKIFPLVKIPGFAFDVEVIYLAQLLGYKVKEIPVTWSHSYSTRVRLFADGFKMLLDLLQVRWLHRHTGIR